MLSLVVLAALAGAAPLAPGGATRDASALSEAVTPDVRDRYRAARVSPLEGLADRLAADDLRVIEPTSPILGTALVDAIRDDPRPPRAIVAALDAEYPTWERDVTVSALAYLRTLQPELGRAPDPTMKWTLVEHAAIPLEVLAPLRARYLAHVKSLEAQLSWTEASDAALSDAARDAATRFRHRRTELARVRPLLDLASVTAHFCPEPCAEFVRLNVQVVSPEDSFPRGQYSVNGFTSYVYDRLLASPDLGALLDAIYTASTEWLDAVASGAPPIITFIEHIERRGVERGFSRPDVFLVLAYALRNMPSLDLQYAVDVRASLLLEVYFWKFRQVRDRLLAREVLPRFSPTHGFDVNPGLYHFTTAVVHACELRRAGFPGVFALSAALAAKLAYKTHKLMFSVDGDALADDPVGYLPALARRQGFFTGVEVGWFGGALGAEWCEERR